MQKTRFFNKIAAIIFVSLAASAAQRPLHAAPGDSDQVLATKMVTQFMRFAVNTSLAGSLAIIAKNRSVAIRMPHNGRIDPNLTRFIKLIFGMKLGGKLATIALRVYKSKVPWSFDSHDIKQLRKAGVPELYKAFGDGLSAIHSLLFTYIFCRGFSKYWTACKNFTRNEQGTKFDWVCEVLTRQIEAGVEGECCCICFEGHEPENPLCYACANNHIVHNACMQEWVATLDGQARCPTATCSILGAVAKRRSKKSQNERVLQRFPDLTLSGKMTAGVAACFLGHSAWRAFTAYRSFRRAKALGLHR